MILIEQQNKMWSMTDAADQNEHFVFVRGD